MDFGRAHSVAGEHRIASALWYMHAHLMYHLGIECTWRESYTPGRPARRRIDQGTTPSRTLECGILCELSAKTSKAGKNCGREPPLLRVHAQVTEG